MIRKEESPRISRDALLNLVEWRKKQQARYIKIDKIKPQSLSTYSSIETNGNEETQINSKEENL